MRNAVIMITIVTTVIIIIMRSAGRSDDSGPPSQSGSNDPRLSGPYYLHYCLDSITWPELPLIAIFTQLVSIRSSYIYAYMYPSTSNDPTSKFVPAIGGPTPQRHNSPS